MRVFRPFGAITTSSVARPSAAQPLCGTKRLGLLLVAVVALASVLTPIAPANAYTISPGFLMYTDLFRWPNWREILGKFDCTEELTFYLWNAPSPPHPVTIAPSPVLAPLAVAFAGGAVDPLDPVGSSDAPDLGPTAPIDPIGEPGTPSMPGGNTPTGATAVPEPSTWAMLLLGFAGLAYAGYRRSKGTSGSTRAAAGVRARCLPVRP
jgi:PEP-CTERM motif